MSQEWSAGCQCGWLSAGVVEGTEEEAAAAGKRALMRHRLVVHEQVDALRELKFDGPIGLVHLAGVPVGLVQRCSRCGYVLSDLSNAMVALRPGETVAPPSPGWPVGEEILVMLGNPRFLAVRSSLKPDRDTSDELPCDKVLADA